MKIKPAWWFGTLALAGAILGHLIYTLTGFLDWLLGAVIGMMLGLIVYYKQTRGSAR